MDALPDFLLGPFGHPQAEPHILFHRHMRIERKGLKYHGHSAAGGVDVVHLALADPNLAFRDFFETGNDSQQGRLSAPGWADEDHELAIFNLDIDSMNDLGLSKPFHYALKFQACHDTFSKFPPGRRFARCFHLAKGGWVSSAAR